ncbi:IMPACT family protein [Halorubrum ezzemoulense]|uniref:IMPACT family protein n=1 Tax=Halorubrum ezzemoulense TaxID=337243 RepID=UPI0023303B03|nr:YigZ family protein [Halorubrum ezzemoulense]MDB2238741.1 IMPACT family protein [Halorubrum ezzemoulense]MDB2248049.1 IMPACT family protein [Halorubrum ezzemoulense]
MTDAYRTVAERATARFEVQGSEFLGHVAPVDTIEAAESFVEAVRDEYADATHNVPAYRVPAGGPSERARESKPMLREYSSDDGEPTGSAGKPALNVLQQREIRNVAAVVTRYYGGTNLGVGGLARAYSRAVKEGVDAAGVTEERPHRSLVVETEYDDSGTVRGVIESSGVEFDADYGERVRFDLRVPVTQVDALRERLNDATSGRVEIGR